jgi:pyruvate dehydrogenase E1 component
VLAAADLLRDDWGVEADVWSVTSFTELGRDGMACERRNRLHADQEPEQPYVAQVLEGRPGPVVAATDYIRQLPDMIRPWVDRPYTVLGTDGYGRSDYRKALRRFFEVDRHHVVVAALEALGRPEDAAKAIAQYEIDPDREAPWRT